MKFKGFGFKFESWVNCKNCFRSITEIQKSFILLLRGHFAQNVRSDIFGYIIFCGKKLNFLIEVFVAYHFIDLPNLSKCHDSKILGGKIFHFWSFFFLFFFFFY